MKDLLAFIKGIFWYILFYFIALVMAYILLWILLFLISYPIGLLISAMTLNLKYVSGIIPLVFSWYSWIHGVIFFMSAILAFPGAVALIPEKKNQKNK